MNGEKPEMMNWKDVVEGLKVDVNNLNVVLGLKQAQLKFAQTQKDAE